MVLMRHYKGLARNKRVLLLDRLTCSPNMYLIRNPGKFGLRPSPVGHLKMCLEEQPENIAARKNSFYWVERQERAEANRNRKRVSLHPVWQELKVSALVTPSGCSSALS
ncbi:hypothetical protein ILYODFUR_037982 [Ilyodon furcidens]|uniref:Uncharacterized protein n=1 Tax=Ilyodon furcidens TaxID=33524 RepID=A0ABV0THG3_9TELE